LPRATKALLRILLVPAGAALGFGWGGFQDHVWWGEPLLGAGIFSAVLLLPFVWKQW
jgi:hypothetical protein